MRTYRQLAFVAAVTSLGVTGLWFGTTWRFGFNHSDEGFYWYGAQRVLAGELPIRDFMSYDIGRYFWTAAIMHLIGDDGIFGARFAAAMFQAAGTGIGVFLCLTAARGRLGIEWPFALLVASILTVWAFPYYKVYDHGTSVLIVGMLALMLLRPSPGAWLGAGICLGMAAMMGRNHGVYGAAATLILIGALLARLPPRRVLHLSAWFTVGVAIGFSPTVLLMLRADGFGDAFTASIVGLFERGATNIGLPVPWPWSLNVAGLGFALTAVKVSSAFGFVLILLFPLAGLAMLAYRQFDLSDDRHAVLMAAVAASIPYAHYAFARADVAHLALAIFPTLIGVLALAVTLGSMVAPATGCVLLAFSLLALGDSQPILVVKLLGRTGVAVDVSERTIFVSQNQRRRIQALRSLLAGDRSEPQSFLAVPDMPGFYAMLRIRMPIWEIYSLWPRSPTFQQDEIDRMMAFPPRMVILSNHALDGKEHLRYSRTHPVLYQWIIHRYRRTDLGARHGDPGLEVYLRDPSEGTSPGAGRAHPGPRRLSPELAAAADEGASARPGP